MSGFVKFTNSDGTVEYRAADYDEQIAQEQVVNPPIPEAELAAVDAVMYRQRRTEQYPSIGDQLDALFHAGVFPDDMAAQIQAVKDANPKPSE